MTGENGGRRLTPRRPVYLDAVSLEEHAAGWPDPATASEVAHATAQAIVHRGRSSTDPAVVERLVSLVDDIGLSTLAELWAQLPGRSLPGALWRLYALREWVRRDPVGAAADYEAGARHADVLQAIAGAARPTGPEEVRDLADAILRGVYDGDLALALERAGAFCRVAAAGRADRSEGAPARVEQASNLQVTGDDLIACARLYRRDELD